MATCEREHAAWYCTCAHGQLARARSAPSRMRKDRARAQPIPLLASHPQRARNEALASVRTTLAMRPRRRTPPQRGPAPAPGGHEGRGFARAPSPLETWTKETAVNQKFSTMQRSLQDATSVALRFTAFLGRERESTAFQPTQILLFSSSQRHLMYALLPQHYPPYDHNALSIYKSFYLNELCSVVERALSVRVVGLASWRKGGSELFSGILEFATCNLRCKIVVCAAAGNGQRESDSSLSPDRIDRKVRSSLATKCL